MRKMQVLALLLLVVTCATSSGQQIEVLYNFGQGGTDDPLQPTPPGIIAQGRDGNLYSTAPNGAAFGVGGIFEITPAGNFTSLFSLTGLFGANPYSGLTLGTDGYLYGTTLAGETSGGNGTIFKMDPSGQSLTTLHQFDLYDDGQHPYAPPIRGADGNYYGTTTGDEAADVFGTLYELTPSGALTTLFVFGADVGTDPFGPLVQGPDGSFYGTTLPSEGLSSIFKFTPPSSYKILFYDAGGDDFDLFAGLTLGNDGNFYGTAFGDLDSSFGDVFKITSHGGLVNLHQFKQIGEQLWGPVGGLMLGSDGNFYGTCAFGGPNNVGGVYRITSEGKYKVLAYFTNRNGANPKTTLVQHTSGVLYGDTQSGGSDGDGVFYEINLGLRPFAGLVSNLGKRGTSVGILGQGFTAASGVSFNGVPAKTFQAASDTFLTASVPSEATTGLVSVTLPGSKLLSKQYFWVTPTISSFTPGSGKVGTAVVIEGASLKQTTGVTFGKVPATSFTVNSNDQVTAAVPAGAKTGHIGITTKGGVATSKGTFTVTK